MKSNSKAVCVALLLCVAAGVSLVSAVDHDSRKSKATRMRARMMHSRTQSQAMTKVDAAILSRLQHVVAASKAGLMSTSAAFAATQLAAGMVAEAAFEGYEHAVGSGWGAEAQAADLIQFKFITGEGTKQRPYVIEDVHTGNRCLKSDDGVAMSISELTAIAGDYFAPKDSEAAIICSDAIRGRANDYTQYDRFSTAFEDLWHNPTYGTRGSGKWQNTMSKLMDQLRAMLTQEKDGVDKLRAEAPTAQAPNTNPSSRWYNNGGEIDPTKDLKALYWNNRIEGIGLAEGNVRALAVNDDHFAGCADETYAYGAKRATDLAFAAGGKWRANDKAGAAADLNRAYGMFAFVSHFLSDRFSAGHMRTPRVELRDVCVSALAAQPMAGLTANVMHDEDNWNCILGTNKQHHKWWVCGDHRFFDLENAQNRRILHEAIKAAVKEVSDAFEAGVNGGANPTAAGGWEAMGLKYVPTTAGLTPREALENTCPMFKVVPLPKGKRDVFRRVDTDPLHGLPRPPAAITNGYGKSIRFTMSSTLFPAYVDVSTVAKAGLTTAVPVAVPALATDCTYESMGVLGTHCCLSTTRARPSPSTDAVCGDTAIARGNDAKGKPILADGTTVAPNDKTKRMTWINACNNVQDPGYFGAKTNNALTVGTHVVNVGVGAMKCLGAICKAVMDASG